ncbi:MAG TPA: protein kinase [Ktedonobacteraceae bacterium]|jgi:serine/threonine protein kinase
MPEKFNQYNLTETLSKKYSHTTYLASPINEPERQVVLTVFASFLFRFPHERENLLQKVQRIQQVQHTYLVPILDMGIEEEQPFVVREYLPNGSLRRHLKKFSLDRLPLRDALNIVSQVGEALAYGHEHNLVHGNIKPENILFDSSDQAILTDFAVVSRKDAIIRDQTAEEYAFCYLAPEQFDGTYDAKSDQYALGCVAYELITGRVPFAVQSLSTMMGHPTNALPAALSESVADLPPSLEAAILKTLAKDPAERFFDFSLFLEVIRSILSPPPNFPLAHSASSRKNRSIARPMRSVKAKDVVSPISKRTAPPNPAHQSPELSGVISSAEIGGAVPINTASMFQANVPERTEVHPLSGPLASSALSYQIPFPFPVEAYPIDDRENEKKADDWFVTAPFVQEEIDVLPPIESVQEEADVLPVITTENSVDEYSRYAATENSADEYSRYAATEDTLLLAGNPDIAGLRPIQLLHGRRVLGLVLLVSVIVTLIGYVFWPLVMTTHDTSLQTANTKQVAIPQITSVSMVQVPLQVTDTPTVQPSVTDTPIAQPAVADIPPVQPPKPAPTPKPTPTPTATDAAISYEAEVSQNTLAGGARVISCSSCSGGARVGDLGVRSSGESGTLRFNNVNKAGAGTYTLTLYYSNGSSGSQDEYISVNGGPAIVFNGSPTGSFSTFATAGIAVSLNGGSNTIEFSNPNGNAPDVDKIIV